MARREFPYRAKVTIIQNVGRAYRAKDVSCIGRYRIDGRDDVVKTMLEVVKQLRKASFDLIVSTSLESSHQ